jgi:hypothetical protein
MSNLQDSEAIAILAEAWELFFNQCRTIAMMPVEDWIEQLEHTDAIAPIIDPTMYRDWVYSGKREIMLPIFEAALTLKRAVEEAQPKIRALAERERARNGE